MDLHPRTYPVARARRESLRLASTLWDLPHPTAILPCPTSRQAAPNGGILLINAATNNLRNGDNSALPRSVELPLGRVVSKPQVAPLPIQGRKVQEIYGKP